MCLETSSPSHPANPFPLLRLPHELLDAIFEYAYEDEARPEPICRALRVFAEKRFFRDVRLSTYEALRSFASTVSHYVHLRSMVRSMAVIMVVRLNSTKRSSVELRNESRAPGGDERIFMPCQWASLLAQLTHLLLLALSNVDTDFLDVLVDGRLAPSALQRLQRLHLFCHDYPAEPEGWWPAGLARYQSLCHIELNGSRAVPAQIASPSGIALSNITSFSLASCELGAYPGQDYTAFFPNLQRFALRDSGGAGFGSILSTIPDTIRSLSLRCTHIPTFLPHSAFAVDGCLSRFTRLEELHLDQTSFTLARLDPVIRTLTKLRTLSFGLWSPLTDDFLLSLVDGPTRLRQLECLGLNHVDCERGSQITDCDHTLPPEARNTEYHVYPEWYGPEWPPGCSEAGLVNVVEAAEVAGIEVVGTALDVIGFEEDWQCEIRKSLLIWGKQEADFSEARESFGDDFEREGREFFGEEQWACLMEKERGET